MLSTSFKKDDKVYIGGDKLLPIERFLPKPKAPAAKGDSAHLAELVIWSWSKLTTLIKSQRRRGVEPSVAVEVPLAVVCEVDEVSRVGAWNRKDAAN